MSAYQSIDADVQHQDKCRSLVFGGLDGVISTMTILCAAIGGDLPVHTVLTLGMSCIFADGLAVGMGEYLSSKAHNKYVQAERRRQQYDYRNCRDEEMRSLVDLFKLKGMRLDDAELIVSKLSQYENLFVNLMMTERKGLLISEDTELELCTDAGVTFLSFALFGSLPLFAVLICAKLGIQSDINYGIALLLTSVMIIIFGFIRSTFSVAKTFLMSLQPICIGMCCGTVSYCFAVLLCNVFEDDRI